MHEVPLVRLLRYYHAIIWANGAWTRRAASSEKRVDVDALLSMVKQSTEDDDGS